MGNKRFHGLGAQSTNTPSGTRDEMRGGYYAQHFPGNKGYNHREPEPETEPLVLGRPMIEIPGIIPSGIEIVHE